jgi:hypothetical protein
MSNLVGNAQFNLIFVILMVGFITVLTFRLLSYIYLKPALDLGYFFLFLFINYY